MPFRFWHFVQFWMFLMHNEVFSYICWTSTSQLNTQKSVCNYPCGLQQKSVFESVTFQGCMTVVFWRNQRYLPTPHCLSRSHQMGLPLFVYLYLLIKTLSSVKGMNNRAFSPIDSIFLFLSVWEELFFTSICKIRDICLCLVCLAAHLLSVWLLSL